MPLDNAYLARELTFARDTIQHARHLILRVSPSLENDDAVAHAIVLAIRRLALVLVCPKNGAEIPAEFYHIRAKAIERMTSIDVQSLVRMLIEEALTEE